MIQIFFAVIAGILTIAAPCILLPLPILLGASVGQRSKTRPLFITLGFVVTFATLALAINYLVQVLGLNPNTLRTVAIVVLAVFSFFMIWPTPFERLMAHLSGLMNQAGQASQHVSQGNFGGFILGAIIGIVWAPCAGPILGSILTLVALQKDALRASILLIAYAIGAGIPMLAIAYGGQALTTRVRGIAKYSHRLQQVFGVLLLLLAGAIYFQYDTVIQAKLVSQFPNFGAGLEAQLVEQNRSNRNANLPAPLPAKQKPMAQIEFQNYGPAPEFSGISHWLNSEPLTMTSLRGKVVLVDFWTYTCINCIRTLPHVTQWYEAYKDKGLVIIGVHTPEFAFEKETVNVQNAITHFGIHYPVAQDNDYATWESYNNRYWPAEYLIDQQGNIRYTHFGEGNYDHTENAIRSLLGLDMGQEQAAADSLNQVQSPEMYLGTERLHNLSDQQQPSSTAKEYSLPRELELNSFALQGSWQFKPQSLVLMGDSGKIRLPFYAGKIHIVADNPTAPTTLAVMVDGKAQPTVTVTSSQLYTLFDSTDYTNHLIEITITGKGFEAFTFTFG